MGEAPSGASAACAKDTHLSILTKTGEVLALCYVADCTEGESYVNSLLQNGYEEVNVIPKPIECGAAGSELQFSIQAENGVKVRPSAEVLQIRHLKLGSPRRLIFKCSSPSGGNALVRLIIKEGGCIIDEEDFDVICMKEGVKTAQGSGTAAIISGGNTETVNMEGANVSVVGNQRIFNQATINSPVYNYLQPASPRNEVSNQRSEGCLPRVVLAGSYVRSFVKAVNKKSRRESLGGVADRYDEQNLREPDFEVDSRMKMPKRFYHGELASNGRSGGRYFQEPICSPTMGPLNESEIISRHELIELISAWEGKTRVIALLGMAGSGKSTLIKRLVRDVRSKRSKRGVFSNPTYGGRFELIRLLNIKDIAEISHPVSARELLFSKTSLLKLGRNDIRFGYDWVIRHEEKVLFAFDGLDQASWVIPSNFQRITYYEKARAEVVIANVLSGNLFEGAKILLTSREHSVSSLSGRLRPKTIIVLMGLDLEDAEKVFNALISLSGVAKSNAFRTLSPGIIPLCTIPLFLMYCAIIFIINPDLCPNTMSAVVHEIFKIFFRSEHAEKSLEGEEGDRVIAFFKSVSLKAILDMRVNFSWEEFQSAGLTPQMISQFTIKVPGLSTLSQKLFDNDYKVFFNHQTLQEHFASMEICEKEGTDFKLFASTELCQPHMSVVRRFVCGLLSFLWEISEFVSIEEREEKWNDFKETLREQAENATSSDERLELLALLYESQDQDLIQSLVTKIDFADVIFTPATAHALATILTSCQHLRLFRLKNCQFDKESVEILNRVTENAQLQVDVVELDESNECLLQRGYFIENLQAKLILYLDSSDLPKNKTPEELLSRWQTQFQFVAVVVDAQTREAKSIIVPTSSGEPHAMEISHKIVVPDPTENPAQPDGVVIKGPSTHLLMLEVFIKYLQPKALILLLTDATKHWSPELKWSLDDTCVMVFDVDLGEYAELLISSPFCDETKLPDDCNKIVCSMLKDEVAMADVIVMEGSLARLLELKNFVRHLQPKVLVLISTEGDKVQTAFLEWSLDGTLVMVFEASYDGCRKSHKWSLLSLKSAVPERYLDKIALTLQRRLQSIDCVDLSESPELRGHGGFNVVGTMIAKCDIKQVELCKCKMESSHVKAFVKSASKAKFDLLNVSKNPELRKNHGFGVVGTTVAQCDVKKVKMRKCKMESSHMKEFANRASGSKIELLDVSENPELRGASGFNAVGSTVAHCGIQQLKMSSCKIDGSYVRDFADGAGNSAMELLDVSRNPGLRYQNGFNAVGATVAQCGVKQVLMSSCGIDGSHMDEFANGAGSTKITYLDLSWNGELKKGDGFVTVGSTAAQCKVEKVSLECCQMNCLNIKDFGKGAGITEIRELNLSGNEVNLFGGLGEEGLVEISDFVKEKKVQVLVMEHCGFEAEQLERFKKSIPGIIFKY